MTKSHAASHSKSVPTATHSVACILTSTHYKLSYVTVTQIELEKHPFFYLIIILLPYALKRLEAHAGLSP